MKKFKSAMCVLLVLCFAVGLCSCAGNNANETQTKKANNGSGKKPIESTITLPVAHNDTLDPFRAKSTVNRMLVTLLYDSLFTVDETFDPQAVVADGYSMNGTTLSVHIRTGATFSDGKNISAYDVIYSFDNAKRCDYYTARLSNISSASGEGDTVVFRLKSADIYALSCLDFPIVEGGTVQAKYESTQLYDIVPPVGSGRYVLNGKVPTATLVSNKLCPRGKTPEITTINLFEVSDSDGMTYGLEIGNYDYWYDDLSGGSYIRVNSGMSVVQTNNLVFIGFNKDKSIFTEAPVRRAISQLVDRDLIASQGFQGHATPSVLPFNPEWGGMDGVPVSGKTSAQVSQAKSTLEKAGYTSINGYGYRCSRSKSLTASLTVCKENKFKVAVAKQIKQQLAELNFNVMIVELSYEDYTNAIAEGRYEMYIGEVKIPANMSLSAFFSSDGEAYSESALGDGYKQLAAGTLSISDFAAGLEAEMPFVPLCYRCGMAIYTRALSAQTAFTCYDSFYGIEKWTVK